MAQAAAGMHVPQAACFPDVLPGLPPSPSAHKGSNPGSPLKLRGARQKFALTTIVMTTIFPCRRPMGIRDEIKQNKQFPGLEAEAVLALLRTADQLQARIAEMLKPHGLSPTQYNALRILRGAGTQGLACSEIGERMINRDPDITRLLDRLERRGMVSRDRDPNDRRVIKAHIQPAGLKLLQSLDRPIEQFQRTLLGHVKERQLRTLIRLLDVVRAGPASRGRELKRVKTKRFESIEQAKGESHE
jgi:MarR family transcriptional regulator, organic hydroperoxide resistance regulator